MSFVSNAGYGQQAPRKYTMSDVITASKVFRCAVIFLTAFFTCALSSLIR